MLPLVWLVSLVQFLLVLTAATAASQQLYCQGISLVPLPPRPLTPQSRGGEERGNYYSKFSVAKCAIDTRVHQIPLLCDVANEKQFPVNLTFEEKSAQFNYFMNSCPIFNFQMNLCSTYLIHTDTKDL